MSQSGSAAQARGMRESLLASARDREPRSMSEMLDQAAAALGLGHCVDQVLFPAVRRLGLLRGLEDIDDAVMQLAVETVRAWIERMTLTAPLPRTGSVLLLSCGPGERHSLGLEALVMLLRHRHRGCRMLGGRVSARALSFAVAANLPVGVVLASHLLSRQRQASELLRQLHSTGVATFYAGAAFDTADMRQGVPGTYLGTELASAAALIIKIVDAEAGPPSYSQE